MFLSVLVVYDPSWLPRVTRIIIIREDIWSFNHHTACTLLHTRVSGDTHTHAHARMHTHAVRWKSVEFILCLYPILASSPRESQEQWAATFRRPGTKSKCPVLSWSGTGLMSIGGHGGSVHSTVASQQEGCGFKSRMAQHVGACSWAFLCGVCMFSCVPPIEPHKNMQKEQMLISPVPDQDRTLGPRVLHCWLPASPGFPWGFPWGRTPGWIPPNCMCVCHHSTLVCN